MIGVKFKISNEYDSVLYKILKNTNLSSKYIKIFESEVYKKDGNYLFKNDLYSIADFKNTIKEIYYPVFLKLQFYESNVIDEEINNYLEFMKSNCELILFIIDNIFVEIYSKNTVALDTIVNNLKENNYSEIKTIDYGDIFDGRL